MKNALRLSSLTVAISLALGCMSEKVFAGESSGVGYITELFMPATGEMVRIAFSQPIKNPEGCEGTEHYIRELPNTIGASRFAAMLLAAYMQRKKVAFWIHGCTMNQWWGKTRPQPLDIYIVGD